VRSWITASGEPAKYDVPLPAIYESVFSREFPLYHTPDRSELRDDLLLLSTLVRVGRFEGLIGVVDLALRTAKSTVLAMGPTPETAPSYPENRKFADAIQAAMWLTEFAFVWVEELLTQAPAAKPKLSEVWKQHQGFLGFFFFLGPLVGYRQFGISSYYETEADWITSERTRLTAILDG
jgi:hypothetical protein